MSKSVFGFSVLVLLFIGSPSQAQGQKQGDSKKSEQEDRRCAYLGLLGSFHVLGNGGSAAYTVDSQNFIADLRLTREDANFWYFAPANGGDPMTTEWAFSKKPDGCGMYLVWRRVGGIWYAYERTRAWGIGLGGIFGSTQTVVDVEKKLEARVESLEDRVKKLEDKKP